MFYCSIQGVLKNVHDYVQADTFVLSFIGYIFYDVTLALQWLHLLTCDFCSVSNISSLQPFSLLLTIITP